VATQKDHAVKPLAGRKAPSARTAAVLERFRTLCLRLPETREVGSWGHPNFRAGKRTFATIEWIQGRPSLAFRLGAQGTKQFLANNGPYFATPYGRDQWLSIWVDGRVDWDLVGDLVNRSYRLIALKRMITALDA
jgi:predicted DNA-binding protein (MmcQ/YjbR family)